MAEPVTLEEARAQVRVTAEDEDDLITSLIVAAREWVENYTGLILVEREIVDTFDMFGVLALSAWPVADDATVVISYADPDGTQQTTADIRILAGARPARVLPAFATAWPAAYPAAGVVTATYTAGYALPADVPQSLKQAILLLIGHWYSRREAAVVGATAQDLPMAVEALTRPYRLAVIG